MTKTTYYYEDPIDTLDYVDFPVDDSKIILDWTNFRAEFNGLDKQLTEKLSQ